MQKLPSLAPWMAVLLTSACNGMIGDPGLSPGSTDPSIDAHPELHVAEVGLTRLTPHEYDNTVEDLLGTITRPSAEVLPLERPDPSEDHPFERHYESQQVSATLVEAAESLAVEAATELVGDVARRERIVGCAPTGPGDTDCLRSFVTSFGRRAFRRPLTAEQVEAYVALSAFAVEAGDFWLAVEGVVGAMLMSPSFLYRVEVGTPLPEDPNVLRLDGYEIAARLSYFLWGSMPDDALLAAAQAGELATPDGIRAQAERMLEDPRARRQAARFHAEWLGYEPLPIEPDLAARMRTETEALVERVVFDERLPWTTLFTSDETFIDDVLAEHYGMPLPGSAEPTWVRYEDVPGGRGGVLSHGTFLSLGAAGAQPSPMKRGHRLTTTLLCRPIPPPPPNVETTLPGDPVTDCPGERLQMHAEGGCAGCHRYMDPIGFGLQRYDALGQFRTTEPDRPECGISGAGELPEMDDSSSVPFEGPAELGALIVDGRVQACAAMQLFRFAVGHNVRARIGTLDPIHDEDLGLVDYLGARFVETNDFRALILDLVTSRFFSHRIVPDASGGG